MYRLIMETKHIQYKGQSIRCRIPLFQHKCMQKTWNSTARGTSGTQRDKQNIVSKLINGMPLTFVLVYRDGAMFARSIGEYVIIFNNNQGIVAVYRSL